MAAKSFSRRNLDFILFEVLDVLSLSKFNYFSAHDKDTINFTLDATSDIADKIMSPNFASSDRQQPELINGQVKVHKGVHEFVKTFGESGLIAAPFSNEWNGMQLPKTVASASEFILGAAHNSFIMYTDLTKGAANLIYKFGSQAQKEAFLPKMLSGEWLGTMCLTETQAGSSLSDVATTATPQSDGSYKIKGQKIFISAGDHDVTGNIVHLVLARIEGAPKGTKGISLFIVPKNRNANSKFQIPNFKNLESEIWNLESNDVTSVGIYHKMGQKATPAMHLEFGAKDDCIGYLLGEPNRGLPQMFLMMNGARLGVGLGGVNIASAAYYASLQYAQERPQGRRLNEKNALGEPTTIIHHADVRRLLLSQKAFVEGTLCFILKCYQYLDLEKAYSISEDSNVQTRNTKPEIRYNALLELLTPVAKTYGAEGGIISVNNGLQVLGGYGYTEDFELEQMARDVRIMSLYEGTTGIQAQALLGRQIPLNNGQSIKYWLEEVQIDIDLAEKYSVLKPYSDTLTTEIENWQKVTNHLLSKMGNAEIFLSDATLYLEMFGILNVAWQWLSMATVAQNALENNNAQSDEKVFYESKIQTMQYFYHYEIPKLKGLTTRLLDPSVLTVFDDEKEILM
jgi:alkylation response protein AidB-like acyl-CoA dehydrogenase